MSKYSTRLQRIAALLLCSAIFFVQASEGCDLSGKAGGLGKDENKRQLNLAAPLFKCRDFNLDEQPARGAYYASDNLNELIYSTLLGKLIKVDTNSGKTIWSSDLSSLLESNIVADETSLFFTDRLQTQTSQPKFTLKNINRLTGLINWQIVLPFDSFDASVPRVADAGGKTFLFIKHEKILLLRHNGRIGSLYYLRKSDGGILSKRQFELKSVSAVYQFDNKIFVADDDKKIFVLADAESPIKEISAGGNVSVLSGAGGRLVYGDKKGSVVGLRNTDDAAVWKFRAGAEITDLLWSVYGVIVVSNDNFIYLLDSFKGKLLWKRRLPGRIAGKPVINANYLVAANLSQPEVDVIDLSDGKIVNRLFPNSDDYSVGEIFFQNDSLVLLTNRGLMSFSSSGCRPAL